MVDLANRKYYTVHCSATTRLSSGSVGDIAHTVYGWYVLIYNMKVYLFLMPVTIA